MTPGSPPSSREFNVRSLHVLEATVPSTGPEPVDACCEACAAERTRAAAEHAPGPSSLHQSLPILERGGRSRAGIGRSTDRRIAFSGLILAALWLGSAAVSLLLPPAVRLGSWLPLHMVLAGAATTAIAAFLPFFTAALVSAPPARPAIRVGGLVLVSGGALGVMAVFSLARGEALLAALSGGSFLAGLGLVAAAAFRPLRAALGQRRRLVERAYALALANVAVGATLATLMIGGNRAVGAAWDALKPTHAWLNLIGFVTLVMVATLLHLAPTVVGTRIRPRLSGRLAIIGVGIGAPLVAAGLALQVDGLARTGGLVAIVGALGVVGHGVAVQRDSERGRWTTDAGWHSLTGVSILAGHAWLGLGVAVAAGRVLAFGASPAGWSVAVIVGPLLIGGVVQILVGAATHLLPAIGPGDPLRHGLQRRVLGRLARLRLIALNTGAALVTLGFGPAAGIGGPGGSDFVAAGLATAAAGVGLSLVLLIVAAGPVGRRTAALKGSISGA